MTENSLLNARQYRKVKIMILFLVLLFLWLGLNYRQLYGAWMIRQEKERLIGLATKAPSEFENPLPVGDRFEGKLSAKFWKFTTINGGGTVSDEMSWHAAAIDFDDSLIIQHFPDSHFSDESPTWHRPAADQYNNISLIGARGFRPSISKDVVLKFTAQTSQEFYGTAGVIFEPTGTLQKNGWLLVRSFDMFGFAVIGKESSAMGINGPICYFTLGQLPVAIKPLQVDVESLHTYEVRLHSVSQTEWLGSVTVDGAVQCQITMPSLGPVEVHAWSDNALLAFRPRRWWEIAPVMELKYQDRGEKQFRLGMIQIFEEKR